MEKHLGILVEQRLRLVVKVFGIPCLSLETEVGFAFGLKHYDDALVFVLKKSQLPTRQILPITEVA